MWKLHLAAWCARELSNYKYSNHERCHTHRMNNAMSLICAARRVKQKPPKSMVMLSSRSSTLREAAQLWRSSQAKCISHRAGTAGSASPGDALLSLLAWLREVVPLRGISCSETETRVWDSQRGLAQAQTHSEVPEVVLGAAALLHSQLLSHLLWWHFLKWQIRNYVINSFRQIILDIQYQSGFLGLTFLPSSPSGLICTFSFQRKKWCWIKVNLIFFDAVLVLLVLDLYNIATTNLRFDHRILG